MAKPCKEDQIRNPASNRCVSKTSAIGKRLIKKMSKAAAAPDASPAAPVAPAARAARAAPPVSIRPPASEAYKEQLRRDYPAVPMNILLDMFPEPIIDSDEIKASRIPVFSKRSKSCPENKIKDPETKKCIKINSVKGRQILSKIREIYHGEDTQGYLSDNPFTIKYDNRQLTIPGHSDLFPETDQPQRNRDCPPKTIRDPTNPDKCIKYNSKKGRELIAKYRDYYKEVYGETAAPDYLDIPDFLPPDTHRGERFTLPATEKLSIKTALDKLQEERLRARERRIELEREITQLTDDRNEAERRRTEAEQQVQQLRLELEQQEEQGQRPNNVIERNGQALLFINDPNNINVVREYFEEREGAYDRETFMNAMSDHYIAQQRNRIIRGGENMEFVNNPIIFNQIRQFFIANPDPRRTNFQTFLNLVNQRVNPRNYQY